MCFGEDGKPYIYDGVTPGGADALVDWAEESSRPATDAADDLGRQVDECKDTAENVASGLQSGEYRSTRCAGFGVG